MHCFCLIASYRSVFPPFYGALYAIAHLFGIKPGTYKKEGWEDIIYPIYGASAFLLVRGNTQLWYIYQAVCCCSCRQAGRQAGRHKQSIVESHATCKIDRYKLNEHLENGLLLFKFETTHLISVASFSHLCTSFLISNRHTGHWRLSGLPFAPIVTSRAGLSKRCVDW